MNSAKKPDAVVFDEVQKKYDAALKPYATNVSAPVIKTLDTIAWKNRHIHAVNKQIDAKYKALKSEFDSLMEQFEYNNLVYAATFNFEPIIGFTYHLYRDANQEAFLSVIAPHECNFDYVGTFKLTADKMWQKIENLEN
jgi:hypothetical protein